VLAAHGRAVRGRSKRGRRRWSVGRALGIGSGTGAIGRRGWRDAIARERPKVKSLW
jgi:hypothetical protein